jgi:hypothetical protein
MPGSRAARIQKAKASGRLVLHSDGSIDAPASDARPAAATDPSKSRSAPKQQMRPVPEAAVSASAEPGRYRTDQTPYMRGIIDALSHGKRRGPAMLGGAHG